MRAIISVASMFACALTLNGQIAVMMNRLDDGSTEIRIRNNSTADLTALAISAKVLSAPGVAPNAARNHAPFLSYHDPAIDQAMPPLPPNQERVFGRVSLFCDPVGPNYGATMLGPNSHPARKNSVCRLEDPVTAGIFADGSTTGDGALLTRLILRRSNLLLAVETALDALTDAGRRNVPREQLIGQFKKMADSLRHWYLLPEQQIGLRVFQPIVGKLINLPEGERDAPFPPTAFVAEESAALIKQRAALLESQPTLAEAMRAGR